ncbi:MAG: hypothetical protein JST06_04490 [Bacteroidetes bacterium]|nr:hypothetical protein [Bacteroidota bacterium]MBS1628878.1 hypothetical protein [Bacteroidota bacterium]
MRLLSFKPTKPFKNLNAPYRMVFINEDSLEEVASFHLTKKSVYGLFSTIFCITILATVAVLLFTPLKYYIPGYGNNELRVQALALTQKVDSLNNLVLAGTQRSQRIQQILNGDAITTRDTSMLKPGLMQNAPEGVLPAPEDIRDQADKELPHGPRRK